MQIFAQKKKPEGFFHTCIFLIFVLFPPSGEKINFFKFFQKPPNVISVLADIVSVKKTTTNNFQTNTIINSVFLLKKMNKR